MTAVFAALAPVFTLIALGFALRRFVFPSPAFWDPVEKLTYWVLFPALLLVSMARARVGGEVIAPAAGVLLATMAAVLVLLVVLRRPLGLGGPAFASVVQGSVRFNTYVGLAAASALYGSPGVALLALMLALLVPVSNLVSVLALARAANTGRPGWRALLHELATNPMILASLAGLALSLTRTPLPPPVEPVLDALGRASLALGLLAVGAGLDLPAAAAGRTGIAAATVLKLIVSPLLALVLCRAVALESPAAAVVVLFAALPPAPAAFVMTRRMGGDHALMAGIITVHTVAAAVTLPVMLSLP